MPEHDRFRPRARHGVDRGQRVRVERVLVERVRAQPPLPHPPADAVVEGLARREDRVDVPRDLMVPGVIGPRRAQQVARDDAAGPRVVEVHVRVVGPVRVEDRAVADLEVADQPHGGREEEDGGQHRAGGRAQAATLMRGPDSVKRC